MAVVSVWCWDTGTASDCRDTITAAVAVAPNTAGPNVALRKATWDTVSRVLTYNKAGDMARMYQVLSAAPGTTPADTGSVTISGATVTALSVVRSAA